MSANLQQIGTPLLDMDDIATQLHIKGVLTGIDTNTNMEKYSPFMTLEDIQNAGKEGAIIQYIGTDTTGQPMPVSHFAVAYDPNNGEEIDRNTVYNAIYLDGKSPEYFYTREAGEEALRLTAKLTEVFNKEISEIRAENIKLMSYLAKNGLTDNYRPMTGFYDTFKEKYPVHQKGYLATAFVDSTTQNMIRVKAEEIKYFSEGDYVVVVNGDDIEDNTNRALLKIDRISGTTLIFNGYTGFPIKADQTHVYRSFGNVYKNAYVFGSFQQQQASTTSEIYTGVDDDNYRTRRKIRVSHTGFATTFRISPSRAKGISSYFLSSIEICAKQIGNPGPLKCYVINAVHINDFEDPIQAREDGYILAESQPLTLNAKDGESVVTFDFLQNGEYALLENIDQGIDGDNNRTRFCMIIEALFADSANYYEILFLQHYDSDTNTLSDLQLNNIVYEYSEQPSSELMLTDNFRPLVTNSTINNADLFYGMTLKPVENTTFSSSDAGLYSAEFRTYEPISVNNAKLILRVAKEGYFTVASTSADLTDNVPDGGTIRYVENQGFRVEREKSMNLDGFAVVKDSGEETNRKIIIGTHVTEVKNIDGDKIIIKDGANIKVGDPIYPMSYTASLLCTNKVWDNETQSYVNEGDPVRVPLQITSVQPIYFEQEYNAMVNDVVNDTADDLQKSRLIDKITTSDNLIFEADISATRKFNHFQLQIYWRSMASRSCQSYAGKIFDLSVSLNHKVF